MCCDRALPSTRSSKLRMSRRNKSKDGNDVHEGSPFQMRKKGSADLLGNDDTAKVVHASDNASCFHIYSLLLNATNYDAIICKQAEIIPLYLLFSKLALLYK